MRQETLTMEEMSQRILNISLRDKNHLKDWLEQTNRKWLIFNARDLIDALPFPEGIDDLMRVIACYRERRRQIPSARVLKQRDPTLGKKIDVPLMKDEQLEIDEWDRLIRYCIRVITELDPKWNLNSAPR